MDDSAKKIVQIIPGDCWRAAYDVEGEPRSFPLVAWGLTADGLVVPLEADSSGWVEEPAEDNFLGIIPPDVEGWRGRPEPEYEQDAQQLAMAATATS